jgi:prepilin-type N-terminal cleavage/methylation domain-containing protein
MIAPVRRGVTLVELLVVMAVIAALGALAVMVAPGIAQKDNTLKGTSDVQTAMKVAQGMAAAAKLPRGVRLIAPTSGTFVTEMQYLEVPPVLIPDPQVLIAKTAPGDTTGVNGPRVDFLYTLDTNGNVTQRQCLLYNLNADQLSQIGPGSTLALPVLGFFSKINSTQAGPSGSTEIILEVYPDALLGGATVYRTYHFGIYGSPRPLLGEPTIELPKNICVDLSLCQPQPWTTAQNYDIVFAPSGQLMASLTRRGGGQIFLWVRDYTKVPNFTITPNNFRAGGEQQIVGIRGAAIGTAPVKWPDDMVNGTYAPGATPYTFARDKLTGP